MRCALSRIVFTVGCDVGDCNPPRSCAQANAFTASSTALSWRLLCPANAAGIKLYELAELEIGGIVPPTLPPLSGSSVPASVPWTQPLIISKSLGYLLPIPGASVPEFCTILFVQLQTLPQSPLKPTTGTSNEKVCECLYVVSK